MNRRSESAFYELKPYVCAATGLAAILMPEMLGRVSGLLLLVIGLLILKMRRGYRRPIW